MPSIMRGLARLCACACVCLCLQDIGYADDAYLHTPLQFEYENVYNNYMNWMQNVTATKVCVPPFAAGLCALLNPCVCVCVQPYMVRTTIAGGSGECACVSVCVCACV